MLDREKEEDWPEDAARTGDLAPRVEEYLATVGAHVMSQPPKDVQPPGFWEGLISSYFEEDRLRVELQRLRADWFDARRGRV